MGSSEPAEREIVGVVNDVKTKDLRTDAGPQIYIPYAQQPIGNAPILVRAKGDLAGLLPAITHAVHGVDPESPVYNVGTLQEAVDLSLASSRFDMVLLVVFAAASVVLTVVGLYGVVAYTVAQRTREFGVRMAIGATRADVVRMVLNNGLRLALTGCVIGVAIAVGTTHLLSAMLYGVTALDPLTFVGTTMVLATIAILAAYIPARRASRVDPMTALRYE